MRFEVISKYKDSNINLPKRATAYSAGYDIEAAEDVVVPSIFQVLRDGKFNHLTKTWNYNRSVTQSSKYYNSERDKTVYSLDEIKKVVKENNLRTMVPTGLKVKLNSDTYLALHPRSGTGSNCLLKLANDTGIIDADYYNNEDNEGHIFVALINLSPYDIQIKKGDKIAQGIFNRYFITEDDDAAGTRKGGFGSTDSTHMNVSFEQLSLNDYLTPCMENMREYSNNSPISDDNCKALKLDELIIG